MYDEIKDENSMKIYRDWDINMVAHVVGNKDEKL